MSDLGRPWLALCAYLSPRLTHSDPDGLSTRTHSRVTSSSDSTNSAGVGSSPIWPA